MSAPVRTATVLGAGTMGAQIAAHLANAGVRVTVLDVSLDAARSGLDRLKSLKPDPCFTPVIRSSFEIGTFDDLSALRSSDWIIEAVIENLEIKRQLIAQVEAAAAPSSIVSSNTSGIPIAAIAQDRASAFKRRWLGTHFFNPPRYLHLVEIIPTAETDPAIVERLSSFLDHRLGKGVVRTVDTPGFIANRLGIFGVVRLLEELASGEFTVEEIDAITGPPIGRPKSATFRTIDLAGLDILAAVAADLARRLPEGQSFTLPPLVASMIERQWLGAKSGRGFYAREKGEGESTIVALDPSTMTFRAPVKRSLPSLDAVSTEPDAGRRLSQLFLGIDRVGGLLRRTLGATLVYAATMAPDVASSIDDVDRAMRWGFGWELGPFEIWDAIGVRAVLDACNVTNPPPLVENIINDGRDRFRTGGLPHASPGLLALQHAKATTTRVVKKNAGASLIDLGDGVLAVEFHSKLNTIGGDTIEMLHAGVRAAENGFAALVVGNEAEHFSAGANLMLVLMAAQEGDWDEIDSMVRAFQSATMTIKTAAVPVVVAPAGLALGGGCEICLHAARVQAAAESYIGLVEVGVGLIPAGGGTKEMLLRSLDPSAPAAPATRARIQTAFETIGFAKVSTSAVDAKTLGFLTAADGVTMNRERLIAEAKAAALALARDGYRPVERRSNIPVAGAETYALLSLGIHLAREAGRISDHDARIGRSVARVLAGGDLPRAAVVSEDYLLDLEREAFLSLCGESKTLERIAYTLKTGKTLRN